MAALAILVAACSQARAPEPVAQENDCGRCHGYPPPPNGPFIMPTTTFHPANDNCNLCHPGTVQADNVTIVPGGLHMDGVVEAAGHPSGYSDPARHGPDALVFIGGGAGNCTTCHTAYGAGSTGKSCNECHAGSVDDWQTNCTFCHGTHANGVTAATPAVAPPQSVAGTGAQDASNRRVGAHQAHLAAGEFANAFPCASCHTPVPTAALGHFAGYGPSSSVTPAFGALASTGVTGGAAYAGNGGSCATYCHGSGTEFTDGGATKRSPPWTQATIACGDCHALPPASGPSYPGPDAHTYHVEAMGLDCGTCHPGYSAGANKTVDPATHVDGAKQVKAGAIAIDGWDCNACHTELHVPLMHAVPFLADHDTAALGNIASCASCHGADYGGTSGVPSCNQCHTNTFATSAPDWKQNCSFCHGTRTADVTTATAVAAPPQSVDGTNAQDASNPKIGAHQVHLAPSAFTPAMPCGSCHTVPAGGDLAHFTGWSATASVTPAFSALATNGVTNAAYTAGGGTCAVYCHGSGTQFPGNSGTVSPAWTARGTATCGTCHGLPPTSGPTVSGQDAHAFHVTGQSVACATCHLNDYASPTADKTNHVNGVKDVVANGAAWNCAGCHTTLGISHPDGYLATHTADALADIASCKTCHGADYTGMSGFSPSCTGCHSALTPSMADWQTNCTFCHGTRTPGETTGTALAAPPQSVAGTAPQDHTNQKVGAHQAHLVDGPYAAKFTCATCHTPTPTDPLGHFAGWTSASSVTPAFSPLGTNGAAGAAYTAGSCTVYCHGSGTAWPTGSVAANKLPAWTSTGLTCDACHASRPATGAHIALSDHATALCMECHLGYAEATSVDRAYHVNGKRDIVFTNRVGGVTVISDTSTTGGDAVWNNCANCHTRANTGNVYAPPF